MRRLALIFSALCVVACGDAPQPPLPPDPDQARECHPPGMDAGAASDGGGAGGCRSGEICLEGRCYRGCSDDSDCGPREMCASSGACISGTPRDGGMRPDSGPPDPCRGVTCEAPQVCHPVSATCTDCSERTVGAPSGTPGACSAFAPICDIANGRCIALGPSQCTACNSDDQCNPPDGSFVGSCIAREVLGIREQVCMAACATDGTCPMGLECDADTSVCMPPVGMPCTNWRAGTGRASCMTDADCAPLGATSAVYPESCEGEMPGDPPVAGTCLLPCGATDDCFEAGQECLGKGTALFCRTPPPP